MIVAWKYRTSFENAHDSFEKMSKFQKDAGAEWINMFITTGADNGSFITAIGFENMQAYGKMDDMWNAPNSGMDQLMAKNLNQIDLIETYNLNMLEGNIEGDHPQSVFSNWLFECEDQAAVKESHGLDWNFHKDFGCTGIDIHQIVGGEFASNNKYMFVARFNSMEDLGACYDSMRSEKSYGESLASYHSKIKIFKNFNGRMLKSERFK